MYLNLLKRYHKGEEIEVWKDIHSIKNFSINDKNYQEALIVLEETIQRVKFNIIHIYESLQKNTLYEITNNLLFQPETIESIEILESSVKEYGYIPFSLKYLYKIIGSIDLSYSLNIPKYWSYADGLFVESIKNVLELMNDGSWNEIMDENTEEGLHIYLEFSPDYYHKDDVSGGMAYGIEITQNQEIDSKVLNTKYGDLYFIDYLRLCFQYGGFPNIEENNQEYDDFINSLKKELKRI